MSNLKLGVLLLAIFYALPAFSQNTGGVFGPVVNEGHRSFQYRYAFDNENNLFAHRLHYQHAVNDDFRWRILAQRRDSLLGNEEHDFVQGELLWQLPDLKEGWRHGLRFDFRHTDDGRPDVFGLNWTHSLLINERWSSTFLLLTAAQVGGGRESGVLVQTRADINYRQSETITLALSMFNLYGFADDIPGFSDQFHQIGPTLKLSFKDGWKVRLGYLAGVTDRTPDNTFRFWLTKSL